jgi:dinuclear metal center YbgI/SA1388 family protein
MPAVLNDIVNVIEQIAPLSLAYEWDNSGLLLRCSDEVNRILIALDVTEAVAREAEEKQCDMILSHHPLIFEAVKQLDYHRTTDAVLMRLVKAGISLYSAHTSFDRANGGINDSLAGMLGLSGIEVLPGSGEDIVRTGYLEKPCCSKELVNRVKHALGINAVKASKTEIQSINKIAVVGGSGGDFVEAAKQAGAQALVTGEAKHHHFIDAQFLGMLLIEAGHFETERCFTRQVFMSLHSRLNELQLSVELIKADSVQSPYEYI